MRTNNVWYADTRKDNYNGISNHLLKNHSTMHFGII